MTSFEKIDYSTDEFCRFYDELPLWSAPFGLLLLAHVPLRSGAKILDVGAGSGFLSIELAQRCGASSEIVAVDPWGAAIRRLQEKTASLGLTNIRLVESTIESAGLPPDSFDLVVSNLGINNFEDPAAALAECYRVLKPGGKLLMTTNTRGHMAEFYAVYRSVLHDLELPEAAQALEEHVGHRPTEESLAGTLQEAGFQVENQFHDSFVMRFADGSALLQHYFIRMAFLPGWLGVCPEDRAEEVFAILEKRLNALASERGDLSLSIPMTCVQLSHSPALRV